MARSHIAAALAVACFGLLIAFHLISQFGLPNVGFFHFGHGRVEVTAVPNQIPFGPAASRPTTSKDGPAYLLGVGKADITGYLTLPQNSNHRRKSLTVSCQAGG